MADYWMKLYIEILDDPKMATLPDRLWRRTIEVFLVAKKLNKDGHLPDTRQIAWLLRMNADDLETDLIQIATTGIIVKEVNGWFIPNFIKRQSAVPDAERQQQSRKRKQSQEYTGNVTNLSRSVTQSTEYRLTEDREQNTETDTEQSTTPPDPFDVLQRAAESKGIVLSGDKDISAMLEIVGFGATEQDLLAGIEWRAANNGGKPVRFVSQLVGPTRTAMAKRLQSSLNGTVHELTIGAGGRVTL